MEFELCEEHRKLKELVARFVESELMPLEENVLAREASGKGTALTAEERARIDERSKELGLWGLDAPEDVGGSDLPLVALIGVNEELGRTVTPYVLPPDSPNLRMLIATCNPKQRVQYLEPYVKGGTVSAIGISEPGAGSDPA
ncbi:MAG: acyl-CoA dehydrogenase family protein, partial [Candidatus Hydrogenedentota bacterium]